jgi:HD-GYP domain-containing protein (c-di-GMP phosphodiesterase class II)
MQGTAVRFRAPQPAREYRFRDVISGLSVALDLGEGQTPGHAHRTAIIGLRLADDLGLPAADREPLLHTLLLKDAGCSGNASIVARELALDDHHAKRLLRAAGRGEWPARTFEGNALVARLFGFGHGTGQRLAREFNRLRSEAGARIATVLECDAVTIDGIRSLDEHWDGGGLPAGLSADGVPLAARISSLAQTLDLIHTTSGPDAAIDFVRERRGEWFDPTLVDVCASWRNDRLWWHELLLEHAVALDGSLALEDERVLDEDGLDRVAEAFALVIDGKNPYAANHSRGVATIATGIGTLLGYQDGALRELYRAALLHDLGNLSLSNRILDKAAPLTDEEREIVKQHPRFTWSILRRVDAFEDVGWPAALHHERLDGSGYPWGHGENELDVNSRILAVADSYEAVTQTRAYRDALPPDTAIHIIGKDSPRRYDARVFKALEAWIALGSN